MEKYDMDQLFTAARDMGNVLTAANATLPISIVIELGDSTKVVVYVICASLGCIALLITSTIVIVCYQVKHSALKLNHNPQ